MKVFRWSNQKVIGGFGIKVEIRLQEVKERVDGEEMEVRGVNFFVNQVDMKRREEMGWVM